MMRLLARRLLEAIPTLVAVSLIMFVLVALGPNPLDQLKQDPNVTAADITRLTRLNGWDKPLPEQYARWGSGFVRGDMGASVVDQRPAWHKIRERLPLTLMVMGLSMLLSLAIALPLGAYMALKRGSRLDYLVTLGIFAMMATPSFFIGLLLQLVALKLQDAAGGTLILYTGGAPSCVGGGAHRGIVHALAACATTPVEVLRRLTLPVCALTLLSLAGWSRYMRSETLSVLGQDFIRSARAKGLGARAVFVRHALRNALLPIVTIVALDVAGLFGGATITEQVFGLPGMGSLLLTALGTKDVPVVLAIVMIGATLTLLMNALADIALGMLDPRVRLT